MANQLIPEEQFQTAVPSNNGLLTLRSTNTESPSNNELLDIYNVSELLINNLEYEHINPDNELIPPTTPIEDIPVLFYTEGTCFKNMDSEALITTKEELFVYLCEVLIRFDASPVHYQKEDYEVLMKTLVGSLIYLYDKDAINKNVPAPPFVGLALPNTDPITFADTRNYKYPGIYFAQISGNYSFFNIEVSNIETSNSIVLLVPTIVDELFTGYHKEIFELDLSGIQPQIHSYRNEKMGGIVNNINNVFTTSVPFIEGSLTVYLNGLKERDYTIDTNQQITFLIPPSNIGMIDIVEATFVIA